MKRLVLAFGAIVIAARRWRRTGRKPLPAPRSTSSRRETARRYTGRSPCDSASRAWASRPRECKFDNTGHHHLLIDTDLSELKLDAPLPATDKILHFGKGQTETTLTLPPGKHTLELVFADYSGTWPFDPPLHSRKITITVD